MFEKLMEGAGLQARPQQTKLVEFAREVMADNGRRLVQAGTGTGKSFALLALALEAAHQNKMPSVVVAPTNALVNQYVLKDAPRVAKILGGSFAYLKGRSQYLCAYSPEGRKLKVVEAQAIVQPHFQAGRWEWAQAELQGWGCTGDCSGLDNVCAMQLAKSEAAKADVIVTNGHVLIWDIKVDQMTNGVARLLPAYGALFVDECHELDQVAKDCNSDSIGPNSEVYDTVIGLQHWVNAKVDAMDEKVTEILVTVESDDNELAAMVGESIREIGRLEALIDGMAGNPEATEELKELRKELKPHQRFVDFCTSDDDRFISTITLEQDRNGELKPSLNRKCIDASSWTRPILTDQTSILVSGTIPQSLAARLGIRDAELKDVGTPFQYGRSVLAISPFSAKEKANDFKRMKETAGAVVDMARRSHEQGGGGSLVLFTSWNDLNEVMPFIERKLAEAGLNVPVFTQTRENQQQTAADLEAFKAHGHAVMGGVQSMWTGVDVPGNALRQVVIYRLPWGVPNLEVKAIEKKFGRQPYMDDMMTRLVQGIGRLVRQVEDNGRVFIVDSRAKQQRWWANPMSKHVGQFAPFK